MKHKMIALLLVLSMLLALSGCGEVMGEIAGNVADVAVRELEAQIKATIEKYKVDVIEMKSAVGKLDNDVDSSQQFFFGVLVRSNSDALPLSAATTLGNIFEETGYCFQQSSEIESNRLENKQLTFKHTDFSTGDYFLIWGYTSSLTQKLTDKLSQLELSDKLSGLELPTIPEGWLPGQSSAEGVG